MLTLKTPRAILSAACLAAAFLASPLLAEDAKAPDPARAAAAKELVDTMGNTAQAQASIEQFVAALVSDIASKDEKLAKPAELFLRLETQPDKPRVKAYIAETEKLATDFYAERFTTDEMKAIVAFQKSDAGRKFQNLTPELVGAKLVPRITQFQQQLLIDMQKGISGGAAKEEPSEKK